MGFLMFLACEMHIKGGSYGLHCRSTNNGASFNHENSDLKYRAFLMFRAKRASHWKETYQAAFPTGNLPALGHRTKAF